MRENSICRYDSLQKLIQGRSLILKIENYCGKIAKMNDEQCRFQLASSLILTARDLTVHGLFLRVDRPFIDNPRFEFFFKVGYRVTTSYIKVRGLGEDFSLFHAAMSSRLHHAISPKPQGLHSTVSYPVYPVGYGSLNVNHRLPQDLHSANNSLPVTLAVPLPLVVSSYTHILDAAPYVKTVYLMSTPTMNRLAKIVLWNCGIASAQEKLEKEEPSYH